MSKSIETARRRARYMLALVRIFNGTAALLVSRPFGKRLGLDPAANPAVVYVMRLFGVRTIYIGAELLLGRGDHLRHAVRAAPAIHLSDTVSAIAAGATGQLSSKSARTATVISGVNVVLALLASDEPAPRGRLRRWKR